MAVGRIRKEGVKWIICNKCNVSRNEAEFYKVDSPLFPSGRFNMCKACVKDIVDIRSPSSVQDILKVMDKPWLETIWYKYYNDESISDPFGRYMRVIAALPHYRNLRWGHTERDIEEAKAKTKENNDKPKPREKVYAKEAKTKELEDKFQVSEQLYKKWGRGFQPDEILDFEDLYNEWIYQYQIKTPMHETFLKHAVIASVKQTRAMASGNVADADKYSKMFKEMTAAGKLQPATMTKADLSDGIDTFGQLVRKVEEAKDVIEILPEFKTKPKDKADWVIYMYITYVRRLQNLPVPEYEEIYQFYDERKKEFARSKDMPEVEEW